RLSLVFNCVYASRVGSRSPCSSFLLNASPTPALSTLSLHDALPISRRRPGRPAWALGGVRTSAGTAAPLPDMTAARRFSGPAEVDRKSTTSELQSRGHLVCRLLLEKKKNKTKEKKQTNTRKKNNTST